MSEEKYVQMINPSGIQMGVAEHLVAERTRQGFTLVEKSKSQQRREAVMAEAEVEEVEETEVPTAEEIDEIETAIAEGDREEIEAELADQGTTLVVEEAPVLEVKTAPKKK
jgi:hypothetical protein